MKFQDISITISEVELAEFYHNILQEFLTKNRMLFILLFTPVHKPFLAIQLNFESSTLVYFNCLVFVSDHLSPNF